MQSICGYGPELQSDSAGKSCKKDVATYAQAVWRSYWWHKFSLIFDNESEKR